MLDVRKMMKKTATIRSLGLIDLAIGMLLCSIFLPRFISSMYYDRTPGSLSALSFIIVQIQFYSSCFIGVLYIAAGICLAFLKSFGRKVHIYATLPFGAMIGIVLTTIGIMILFEYKYWVPFAIRYIILGVIIGSYSLITYFLLRTQDNKKEISNKTVD